MSPYAKWGDSKIVDENVPNQPQAPQLNPQQMNNMQAGKPQMPEVSGQVVTSTSVDQSQMPQIDKNAVNTQSQEQPAIGNTAPEPQLPNMKQGGREEEIVGGLRNALERGNDLQKAKQSFLNAGYTQDEVEKAVQMVPNVSSKISKPLNEDKQSNVKKPKQKKVRQKKEKSMESSGKSASSGLVIALIIMVILLIAGAGVTYFFRDKLF